MNTIYGQLRSNSSEIRVYAMQSLVEVARNYYDFLQTEMQELIGIIKDYVLIFFKKKDGKRC